MTDADKLENKRLTAVNAQLVKAAAHKNSMIRKNCCCPLCSEIRSLREQVGVLVIQLMEARREREAK